MYGTVLFSFSYISVMPDWIENPEGKEKSIIKYSCLFTLFFKIIFSLVFANILYFNGLFNFSSYVNQHYSLCLKAFAFTFFLLISSNNTVIHTNLMRNYLQNYSKVSEKLSFVISIFSPWMFSVILLNYQNVLSVINW